MPRLDYGGVETYAIRLSTAMVHAGHEVAILSAGGRLAETLAGSPVRLICCDYTRRGLADAAAVIRAERFDILNGQNFNGARHAKTLADRAQVPYVTTLHGPRHLWQRFAFRAWGRHVITTSTGDTRNCTALFGVRPEKVTQSRQTIDPERHRPGPPDPAVLGEFPGDEPLVLHISRFTNRKAKVATALLEAMRGVSAVVPGVRLVLVCAGGRSAEVARALDDAAAAGVTVLVAEPRPDLTDLFRRADVVVAAATTAIEALACGAPVIAAGRTGYEGIVTTERFEAAHDTLFGDHEGPTQAVERDLLERDLVTVLSNRESYRAASAGLAERTRQEFDPARAAAEVLAVYEAALAGG